MTQEEKAKAYPGYEDILPYAKADFENIFPELKESEDEKIRNWVIDGLKFYANAIGDEEGLNDALSWFENQGEQKGAIIAKEAWKDMRLEVYAQATGNRHEPNYADDSTKLFSLNDIDEIIEKISEKHGEQKPAEYTLEQAAITFLDALSNSPYNNKPITDAQTITKQLLNFLQNSASYNPDALIANEQKPANKVEPKFKVGDWIYHEISGNIFHINKIENGLYVSDEGATISLGRQNNWRLWTIQDAKDGDVLADDYGIYIFDRFDEDDEKCFLCMGAYQYSQKVYENEHMLCSVEVHPATEEQRDLLFQKMKEAGYEWDVEKKELKKIEQKPAWSEEDEPQKELAETYLAVFDKKFPILPTLKGKKLADYKNFLNKCQQILGLKYWSIRPLQAKLFEKLSLLWAAWGAEHLKGLGQTNKEIGSTWHGNKISDTDIEYTRTDAFIEKACSWLKENADSYTWYNEFEGESGMIDEFIEDFKEYLKGE